MSRQEPPQATAFLDTKPLRTENEGEESDAQDEEERSELDDADEPVPKSRKHEIPFEFNRSVARWIEYFSQKDRERFQRFLDRAEPYREAVENILEENNVPTDLYYLGLIESGFNFRAKSRAKAVGVWQFMKATGKLYGLEVDSYVDDRKDPIRATEAAARCLRDLHREFKSWYLAMAAYNAGVGRIRKAVRKGRSNNFWTLVQRRVLPRETMEYVPKFMAARYIGENPELFAFYINEEMRYPDVALVNVPSPVFLETIEKTSGLPQGMLAFVNPHYLSGHTHPGRSVDEIWVPTPYVSKVAGSYQALSSQRISVKRGRRSSRQEKVPVHVVRPGDTLAGIAKKRGLSVAYLREVNHLQSSRLNPGQVIKLSATSYVQKRKHPRKKRGRR